MRSKYHRSDPETLSGIFFGVSDGVSPTNDGISPANMGSIMGMHGVKKRSGPRKMRFIGEDGGWVRDRGWGCSFFFDVFFSSRIGITGVGQSLWLSITGVRPVLSVTEMGIRISEMGSYCQQKGGLGKETLRFEWFTLWQTYKKLLNMAIYSGFPHWKWWFSIIMLVYQRVSKRDGEKENARHQRTYADIAIATTGNQGWKNTLDFPNRCFPLMPGSISFSKIRGYSLW